MRQRIITVPRDSLAEEALDYNIASDTQLIEMELSEDDFLFLFNDGIIGLINDKGNTLIDDFEEAFIKDPFLIKDVLVALKKKQISYHNHQYDLIEDIVGLLKEALERRTGIYFYF